MYQNLQYKKSGSWSGLDRLALLTGWLRILPMHSRNQCKKKMIGAVFKYKRANLRSDYYNTRELTRGAGSTEGAFALTASRVKECPKFCF